MIFYNICYTSSVGGTSTSFGQFSYLSPKGPEEAPIYIVQSERTTNSHRKMKGNVSKFENGVPSTEKSAGDKLTSSHALAVSARSLAVGDSEIYALLLNND